MPSLSIICLQTFLLNKYPRCVCCGKVHDSSEYIKDRNEPVKCPLCGSHPANYKRCTVHKNNIKTRINTFSETLGGKMAQLFKEIPIRWNLKLQTYWTSLPFHKIMLTQLTTGKNNYLTFQVIYL